MKALICGITGQDGSYLAEILLTNAWDVYGVMRRSSLPNTSRIDGIIDPEEKGKIFYGDLADGIDDIIHTVKPDVIYNLAAMSHVKISFDVPIYTGNIVGLGAARILEGIRRINPKIRYYQASSSEMYGLTQPPQNETSEFYPVSPYGCAKLYAYHMARSYRMGYGIYATNGILFNHESPRRGVNFVTRKITRAAARIKLGLQSEIKLGNLGAKRDWGHAKDYMRAITMLMDLPHPGDYVVSTGDAHTVREFAEKVFSLAGLDFYKHLVEDKDYYRPNEVPALCGDARRTMLATGWKPRYTFDDICREMLEADIMAEGGLCKK